MTKKFWITEIQLGIIKAQLKASGQPYGLINDVIKQPKKIVEWDRIQAKKLKEPCLICGTKNKLTKHHLKSGKEISLCRPCHDEVEEAKVFITSMKSRKVAFNHGKQSEKERIQKLIHGKTDVKVNDYKKFYQKSKAERMSVLQACEDALKSCFEDRNEQGYDEDLIDKALKIIGEVK